MTMKRRPYSSPRKEQQLGARDSHQTHLVTYSRKTANFSGATRRENADTDMAKPTIGENGIKRISSPQINSNIRTRRHASGKKASDRHSARFRSVDKTTIWRGLFPIALGIICLLAAAGILGGLMQQKTTATKTLDSLSAADAQTASCSNPSIPSIDWEYWKRENPDIVAWLTIPGTSINYPVAFAPRKQEDFYLSHDAFGEANLYGCLYIPNACENGIESQNICILGHNMSDGTMFAELLSYREAEFLSEHRTFYISTPCETTEYSILKVYFDKSPIAIELSEQKTVLLITCASTDNTPERLIISAQAEQRNNGSAE